MQTFTASPSLRQSDFRNGPPRRARAMRIFGRQRGALRLLALRHYLALDRYGATVDRHRATTHRHVQVAVGVSLAAGVRVRPRREHEVAVERAPVVAIGLCLVEEP